MSEALLFREDLEDCENTHKFSTVNRLDRENQRGNHSLNTPSLIPPHPSTSTHASSVTLLQYWLFQQSWKHCSFLRQAILFQPGSTASFFSFPSSISNNSGFLHHSPQTLIHTLRQGMQKNAKKQNTLKIVLRG